MEKKIMLGNEAIARGVWEAGVKLSSAYPGTPSTEISEVLAKYQEVYTEWAPNEKVALEVAIGGSIAGVRTLACMKHVGLNVASDPLYTFSYTGVNGGLVICVADDPAMHSSQNEQDSRHYAMAAKVPMLEPADSMEAYIFAKNAFELSEKYDTPVLLRMCTRIAHSQSIVETSEKVPAVLKDYEKNPSKYIMTPANAIKRHPLVEERTLSLQEFAENCEYNKVEMNSDEIGIITSGCSYHYVKEVMGDSASILKIGMPYPLPVKLIKDFASKVKTLYVIEELDPFIENHVKALGIDCIGKEKFSILGEFSQSTIAKAFGKELPESVSADSVIPNRPPMMCAGCPHRGLY